MGSYLEHTFVKHIDQKSINTIVECGSRDCLDAIAMNEFFVPDIIYAFECNPESIYVCKENISGIKNIKLITKAVHRNNGKVPFFPTDMDASKDKNIGASSLLWHRDNEKEYIQKRIEVECLRLDTFMEKYNVPRIDLLCMDLQGAEFLAIEGLGTRSKDVHYIITEVSFQSYYLGDRSAKDISRMLEHRGFVFASCNQNMNKHSGFGDALFINKRYGLDTR